MSADTPSKFLDIPWLKFALDIGEDVLGATYAVGMYDGIPWTARKWVRGNGPWLSQRPADVSEKAKYDAEFLKMMGIRWEDEHEST